MQIAMGTLGILALVGIPLRWRVVRRTPLDGWLALFFGVSARSTLAGGHPLEAAGWPRPPWLLLAYFVGYWWLRDREHARRVALVVVAAGAVAGAYGVLQHFTGVDWYRWAVGRATRVRPRIWGAEGFAGVGFFRNYLTYAHDIAIVLTWAGALALRGNILGMVAAVLLTLAIVFSTARGVWIGAVGGGGLLGVLSGRRGLGLGAAGAVVAAMAVAVSPGLRAQAAPVFTLGGVNAGRAALYRATLEIIHAHPLLGLGFGRYKTAAVPYYDRHPDADRRSHAHSNLLQIAAEAGLLGLTAFCLLFAVILRRGFDAVRAATDGGQWATAAGAWVGIATFFLAGLTQYSFGDAEVVIPMWLATAVLMRCADSV